MGKISKSFALFLTLVALMSCLTILTINPVNAQSIPKPATPEFTVELVQKVIDEAPTYTIDPYSGETIIKTNGYHTSYWVVDIKIKNNTPDIYYNYRIKGHFGTEWSVCPLIDNGNGVWTTRETSPFTFVPIPTYAKATSSEYTEVKVDMQGLKARDQVDVQVQALSGTIENAPNGGYMILTGQASDWSYTQTLTVPANNFSPNPTESPSPSPTVPESTFALNSPRNAPHLDPIVYLIPVSIIVAVVVLSVLLYRRHRKTNSSGETHP